MGAESVTFKDAADQPLYEPPPGTNPLWKQSKIIALFGTNIDSKLIRTRLFERLGEAALQQWQTELIADQAWERVWLRYFGPLQFGEKLWVCPSGQSPPTADACCLVLDPGLAFGTGTHPTTALCLEWLATHELDNVQTIDYGCGSGILAIASILLGAKFVFAVDIEPQALAATRENARKNGIVSKIHCCYPEALPLIQADVVIANILAEPLKDLAPDISKRVRPGGHLVLSGILHSQIDSLVSAYACDFDFEPSQLREEWAGLSGVKKQGRISQT